ncbi:hypothetical protein RFI_18712, partial [Reticulomyxa filosa]
MKKLRRLVDREILKRTHDLEYEKRTFYKVFCGKNKIISADPLHGKEIWKNRMEPLSHCLFRMIQACNRDRIHLSHCRLFPFSATVVQTCIESEWRDANGDDASLDNIDSVFIRKYLPLLQVINESEQNSLLFEINSYGKNRPLFKGKYGFFV